MSELQDVKWGERVAQVIGVLCVATALLAIWPGLRWIACLLTKEGAPAWIQAIGALLALAVAIYVSGSQERSEKRSSVLQARVFAKQLVIGMQALGYATEKKQAGTLKMTIATLVEASALSQSTRAERLPVEAMHAYMNLKLQAVQVLTAAKALDSKATPFDGGDEFLEFLQQMAWLVNPEVKRLHLMMNGVPAEEFEASIAAAEFIKAANTLRKHSSANA